MFILQLYTAQLLHTRELQACKTLPGTIRELLGATCTLSRHDANPGTGITHTTYDFYSLDPNLPYILRRMHVAFQYITESSSPLSSYGFTFKEPLKHPEVPVRIS